jgi:hypothetical protein
VEQVTLIHSVSVLSSCEAVWGNYGSYVSLTQNADHQIGTYSMKAAVGANATTDEVLTYETLLGLNLSTHDKLCLWVKSSVATSAGDLRFLVSEQIDCTSPSETLNIPALVANAWTAVVLTFVGTASSRNYVQSIGLQMHVDKGAFDLYVDEVVSGISKAYNIISIRGLDKAEDWEDDPFVYEKALNGSIIERIGKFRRRITIDLHPLVDNTDLVFLMTWMRSTTRRLAARSDVVDVARPDAGLSPEWMGGYEYAKHAVLNLVERRARDVVPPVWLI